MCMTLLMLLRLVVLYWFSLNLKWVSLQWFSLNLKQSSLNLKWSSLFVKVRVVLKWFRVAMGCLRRLHRGTLHRACSSLLGPLLR